MSMDVHQAMYGDVGGAHALLATSASDRSIFAELASYTDRPGNLPARGGWEPYLSGFPFGDCYVVARTFPDPGASRSGMVYTHVLVLDARAAAALDNLDVLIRALPETIHRQAAPSPFALPEADPPMLGAQAPPPLAGVAHALLYRVTGNKPVVWIGQDGFVAIVRALWTYLWPAARRRFAFRLSFGPGDVEGQQLALVATPESLAPRWSGFPTVWPTNEIVPTTRAEAFLTGHPDGMPLRALLSDLRATPPRIVDLVKVERCWAYLDAGADAGADEVRLVARLLGELCPDPDRGAAIKAPILDRLAALTRGGTPSDILALRNFDSSPYRGGAAAIDGAISAWTSARFSVTGDPSPAETADVVARAFAARDAAWAGAVRETVRVSIDAWPSNASALLWRWWLAYPDLVDVLGPSLPRGPSVEAALVAACPSALPDPLAKRLRALAVGRAWYALHAVAAAASLPADAALRLQMGVDRDSAHMAGMRALSARIPAEVMLDGALAMGDDRLIRLAGEAAVADPALLRPLDGADARWRRIWLHAIDSGASPFAGIAHPQKTVFSLMDAIMRGESVDVKLLEHVARTAHGNLIAYPRRRDLWDRLQPPIVDAFLGATALGWLDLFAADPQGIPALERRLEDAILDDSRIAAYLDPGGAHPVTPATVALLFSRLPRLTQRQFEQWLDKAVGAGRSIARPDAESIGTLVAERGWRTLASRLAWEAGSRHDLLPAARACQGLLGFIDRWRLGGKDHDMVPGRDDWWEELVDTASRLYPGGPAERLIWARAGGDTATLPTAMTGRARWAAAMRDVRHGGGGGDISGVRLLSTMLDDFPRNETLAALADTVRVL